MCSNNFILPGLNSKSTLKIVDLVVTILEEITENSNENNSYQYFINTAKSVFEMYISIVPNIHEKLLNTIPQQVGKALFSR